MAGTKSHSQSPSTESAPALNPALERNIDAVLERRRREAQKASLQDKVAIAISAFAGSMPFVYLHLLIFGGWIAINTRLVPALPAWDPSLVALAMVASVEAIFLSTFVLINQNRMAGEDNARAELDLQIGLLNEHETTRLIALVEAIAERLDVHSEADAELEELKRDVAPEKVLDRIKDAEERD
ncbi:DUF1003 domain-containing protein [Devosia sp. PTR5]|uniref:DUF1003 domain-containing protein n=1 Tax=Devosia oryzisoli TaxID=2774138 RepID=A0A927FU70_9HYPH|nr:DUF1003 domain-containing protein [Devosia oryzisoli]MBD8066370.1 DUF1003 domain-containing protein [Devosia oryzisoli]